MAHGGAAVSYSGANSYNGVGKGMGQGPAGMSVGDLSAGHGGMGGMGEERTPTIGGTSLIDGQGAEPEYLMKARALYSCAFRSSRLYARRRDER